MCLFFYLKLDKYDDICRNKLEIFSQNKKYFLKTRNFFLK